MRNVMLGHSGVGKTSYVAATYGTMQSRVEGFHLRTADADAHNDLLSLHWDILNGKYPGKTAVRSEYKFDLYFRDAPVLDFTWADYRGGALTEPSNDRQAADLVRDLRRCDTIMVFCEANPPGSDDDLTGEIGRMNYLISEALGAIKRRVALALIFTKADHRSEPAPEVLETVEGLVEAIKANPEVIGTQITVTCEKPRTLVLPVLFALHHGIQLHVERLQAELRRHRYEEAQHREEEQDQTELAGRYGQEADDHPIINFLEDLFTDDCDSSRATKARERAAAAAAQAHKAAEAVRRMMDRLEPLRQPAQRLGDYLKGLPTF